MISFNEGKKIAAQMFVIGSYEDFSVHEILDLLQSADDLYFNDDDSFLEDNEYDALRLYACRLAPADPYFTGVGSSVRGGKVKLPYPMGSLDQVYIGEYPKWLAKNHIKDQMLCISNKLDGASTELIYGRDGHLQIAYSRGDGIMGADITRHVSKIAAVPQHIDTAGKTVAIRAENIISLENFELLKTKITRSSGKPYKNPRNMVSGRMNASENKPLFYQHVDTPAYEIIGSDLSKSQQFDQLIMWGFRVADFTIVPASSISEADLAGMIEDVRKTYPFEIDGLVVDIDDVAIRQKMKRGGSSLNPPYAFKYKVADEKNQAIATVHNVEWNISKDGYCKPRVQIDPVELCGVTVRNLTGFNAKFINDNKIGPGAKLRVTRSGDVIPFIQAVVEPAKRAQMPDVDAEWTSTGVDLVVKNAHNNATVKFEKLNDFFSSIDIPHLGEGNLKQMFDAGFETPESIISLTQEDIASLIGSTANAKKIFKGMREKFTNIPIYVLMGSHPSMGRGVGVRKMKKLYEAFAGDMSKCESITQITMVDGFEHKTASKIQHGYAEFLNFYREISPYVTLAKYQAPKQGGLSGLTFVFTGFRSKEMEKAIEDAGGKMGTTVSSKTDYLVSDDPNSTSGKAQKARDLGVKVIGVDDLKALL